MLPIRYGCPPRDRCDCRCISHRCCMQFFAAFHHCFTPRCGACLPQRPPLYSTLPAAKFLLSSARVVLTIESACAMEVSGMSWDAVYRLVKLIPRGRVMTYGSLARALRLRGGARAAGRAMAATPSGKGIPWHRVVGERGKLLIREPYASLQRKLLESEGIILLESRVNLKRHLWTPSRAKAPHSLRKSNTKPAPRSK